MMAGCHESAKLNNKTGKHSLTVVIAGNPNCGKTALFNALTGIRQKTGNWPGVTVERKQGYFKLEDREVKIIDLPGIYSFDASSMDEKVAMDYLLSLEADLIINVVDATNLERNLYLSVQLLEMGVPQVIALNMMDIASKRGLKFDLAKFAEKTGCPVVPIVATSGQGLTELQAKILAVVDGTETGGCSLVHDEIVTKAIMDIKPLLQEDEKSNLKWYALKILETDELQAAGVSQILKDKIDYWREIIQDRTGQETDIHISDVRFGHAHMLAQSVISEPGKMGKTWSDRLDSVVLGRISGIPIFLGIIYLMFMFTINIGGAFIDFFDGVAGALVVDGFKELLTFLRSPEWLKALLANGLGGGIQVVATFIPVIAALYLFLSILEDSGYMARAAFVMDRFMRGIGLPGKAFVPLIVGFGCNVPAIMATRTLESERERKLTILMNPFMSCGARLPVYALFVAAFFPANGQNLVFGLYLIGILVAVLSGFIMQKTILPGQSSGLILELPPYHMPTLKGIFLRTWDRVRVFVAEAGQIIIAMVLVLNILGSIGTDGSFGNEDSDNSVLSATAKNMTPLFAPMGIEEDNWPAVVGIFSGILAKEVVVGTLDSLYTRLAEESEALDVKPEEFDLWLAILAAAATIPENLSGLGEMLTDTLSLNVGNVSDKVIAANEQEVSAGIFGAMASRFDGKSGAFAYLLFILLYFPCVATIGAIKREAGWAWAGFVALWTTVVAYIVASIYYQFATFSLHPYSSSGWIGLMLLLVVAFIYYLGRWAGRSAYNTRGAA